MTPRAQPLALDGKQASVLKAVAMASSLIVAAIGAIALIGWILDNPLLKSIAPELVTMKANTAIGLLLSGLAFALLAWREPGKSARNWSLLIAAVVFLIGALTLSEYFFGWEFGIDQLFFHEHANIAWTSQPGRMAPVTAFCFILMGCAIVAAAEPIPDRFRVPILAGLGIAVITMGGLALAGCLAEVWFHAPAWNDSGLALHTAFGFLLLGCAMLALAVARRGLVWSLDYFVTMGFVAAIVVMLASAGVSYNFTDRLRRTAARVTHRQEVLKEIGNAAGGIASLESAERGYIILGDESLLARANDAGRTIRSVVDNLTQLTADDSSQQFTLSRLRPLIAQRIDFALAAVSTRRTQGFDAARNIAASQTGVQLATRIDLLFHEMVSSENSLLDQDKDTSRIASMSTFLILPLGVFLSLTISSLGLFFLNTGVGERVRIEKAWHESEERFHTVIQNLTEGLVISDVDGNLIHWNPAALALHEFSSEEQCRRPLAEFAQNLELSTHDGRVLPIDEWPMSRIMRGEKIRNLSLRVRKLDADWARVFSYGGGTVTQPGGKQLAFLSIADVTERTRADEALRASERQLQSFVDQAPVAIAMFDRDMVYIAASGRWVTDHGQGRKEVIGLCHYDVRPDLPAHWRDIHLDALNGVSHHSDEDLWVLSDGTQQWLRWTVHPWTDSQGAIGGVMILTENITSQKLAEHMRLENLRLEEENHRVAEASRLKSEFLANMSHELRTPLNGIIGFTEFMVDERPGPLNPKQREYMGDVLNSAQHLLQLINDVLDLAKVEAGKIDFHSENFVLGTAVEEVCAVVRGLANKKRIRIDIDTAPEIGVVLLDEHRFKQICYNLLSNAVKFTDPGGSVRVATLPDGPESFLLRVTDTGIGIKKEDMERLFREFEQLDSGASRRFDGTGLGLALTRKLCELQGGSVVAESEYGKGSTFTVVLPRQAGEIKTAG